METNADFVLENETQAETSLILEKYEARNQGVPLFAAHWYIFVPTFFIIMTYALSWILLSSFGMSNTNLGRLFIIVMSVFVPLLAAYAFLKFQTIRLQVNETSLSCHLGWPRDLSLEVSFSEIEKVTIKRGFSAKLFDQGSIVLKLKSGDDIAITNIAKPEIAQKIIIQVISKT